MNRAQLLEKANSLPPRPGCYLMKNRLGEIIYVGKAKSLKSRVSSYFNNSVKNTKTLALVSHIFDFEFVRVSSDAESFVLENNLIKKYTPKYNIRLKDDKRYPYVVIDTSLQFPKLEYLRKFKKKKGMKMFGPYATGSNIREVVKVLRETLKLRDCSNSSFKGRKQPCLLYQLKQCNAPCVGLISETDYLNDVATAIDFLSGKSETLLKTMEERMMQAAEEEQFERAALIRNDLFVLKDFSEYTVQTNAEDLNNERNLDVIGVYNGEEEVELSIFVVRNGILLGSKNFHFYFNEDLTLIEQVSSFVLQYYSNSENSLPSRLVIDFPRDDRTVLHDALVMMYPEITLQMSGVDGTFAKIAKLVYEQAKDYQEVRIKNQRIEHSGLKQLQSLLSLKETPVVLECYDIAIWNGSSPTASQIVFHEGVPDKSNYRYYHLEERPEGNNDFAMMKEVLTRRVKHGRLPDVFIVDGGWGQVHMFEQVLKECSLDVPVVGIAEGRTEKGNFKKEEVAHTDERLVIPGRMNPVPLKKYRELMMIVVQMRDEAHRFSRKLHHNTESKRVLGIK